MKLALHLHQVNQEHQQLDPKLEATMAQSQPLQRKLEPKHQ